MQDSNGTPAAIWIVTGGMLFGAAVCAVVVGAIAFAYAALVDDIAGAYMFTLSLLPSLLIGAFGGLRVMHSLHRSRRSVLEKCFAVAGYCLGLPVCVAVAVQLAGDFGIYW